MDLNKGNMKKIMLLIAFGIAVYLGLQNIYRVSDLANYIGAVFQPVIFGLALAFILNVLMREVEDRFFAPLNRRFTKRWPRAKRPVSILVTLLIIIGGFSLIMFLIIPGLVSTIINLTNSIPGFFQTLQENFTSFSNSNPYLSQYLNNISIDWTNISHMVAQYGQEFAGTLVGSTIAVTTNIFNVCITFILGFVIAISLLFQKEKLKVQAKNLLDAYLPKKITEKTIRVCSLTNRAFSNFITGQCLGAVILGVLCFIGMEIFRFPYALLISVLVAIFALIPILGSIFSTLIGALLILTVSPIQAFWFIVYFTVLQQLEGNLIFPKVVGSKMGLPALWVLVAVTVGGNVFGVIGMLVFIPIFSVLYALLRENVKERLEYKGHEKELTETRTD